MSWGKLWSKLGRWLNANTSTEATRYFYSFPANKLELWMSLESERFLEPVFREFYRKDVILEERRLQWITLHWMGGVVMQNVHPYKRPVIGYEEDIRNLTRSDVQQFLTLTMYPAI